MTHTDEPATFGTLLRGFRLDAGLTQEALAQLSGVSVRGIQDLERDINQPQRGTAQRLTEALRLSTEASMRLTGAIRTTPRRHAPARRRATVSIPNRRAIPIPLTPLIGRDDEVALVHDLLGRSTVRLVTLTGPGGIGKTRLALRLADDLHQRYADGVVFVDLSALTAPNLVPSAIGHALGLGDMGGTPMQEHLIDHLRDKRVLLLLDNLEQVVDAAPAIAQLLGNCREVQALATSRVPLHVRGEHVFRVPPLSLPGAAAAGAIGMSRYAAVALFSQCAQASQPDFRLDDETAPIVAEICARLDGLPLAIELAAARVDVLSPRVLLQRLEQRLDVLVAGPRDLPQRQQTLRNTLAWSYDQLDLARKAVFYRLSVFSGGWSLEAAAAVCNIDPAPGISPSVTDSPTLIPTVLEDLEALVDHNLVMPEAAPEVSQAGEHGALRFRMLETIREFGVECLEASGQADVVRRRHAGYYLALAETAEGELTGPRQAWWLERLNREHDNMRAALEWACAADVALGLRLAGALWRFWNTQSHLSEGRWRLERLLALSGNAQAPAPVRAKALFGASVLANEQGDYPRVRTLAEEALQLYRDLDEKQGIAMVLNILGLASRSMGDFEHATFFHEESLAVGRAVGDVNRIAGTLTNLGILASDQGRYPEAAALYAEGLNLYRMLGNDQGVAITLTNLAEALRYQRDYRSAGGLYRESLTIHHNVGNKLGVVTCIEGLAALARVDGRQERAARLWGAAEVLRAMVGAPLHPSDRADYERNVGALRDEFADPLLTIAWTEGRRMTADQVIAYACDPDT